MAAVIMIIANSSLEVALRHSPFQYHLEDRENAKRNKSDRGNADTAFQYQWNPEFFLGKRDRGGSFWLCAAQVGLNPSE